MSRFVGLGPGLFTMPRLLIDRRGVTSLEYALLAAAIALVLFEVLQAPADALGDLLGSLFSGPGGHTGGS